MNVSLVDRRLGATEETDNASWTVDPSGAAGTVLHAGERRTQAAVARRCPADANPAAGRAHYVHRDGRGAGRARVDPAWADRYPDRAHAASRCRTGARHGWRDGLSACGRRAGECDLRRRDWAAVRVRRVRPLAARDAPAGDNRADSAGRRLAPASLTRRQPRISLPDGSEMRGWRRVGQAHAGTGAVGDRLAAG